jgi:hypothetical protein
MLTLATLWFTLSVMVGSLVKYLSPTPHQTIKTIFQMPQEYEVKEISQLARRVFQFKFTITLVIGAIAAFFNFLPLVGYTIGVLLVYITKTIPEIKKELVYLDLADKFVDKLIQEFLEKKETNEKA